MWRGGWGIPIAWWSSCPPRRSCIAGVGSHVQQAGWLNVKKDPFDILTDMVMFGAVIFETLAVSTIFVFRARMPNAERPYRCLGYPVTPILYILILTAVAINTLLTQRTESAVVVGFVALGAAIYALALRRRASVPACSSRF